MPDFVIRNVRPESVDYLKARARLHGRSLQGELTALLEELEAAETRRKAEFWRKADAFRESLAATGKEFSDSAELIREDRDDR